MSNMTEGMNESDRTDAEEIADIADASEIDETAEGSDPSAYTDRRLVRCGDEEVAMTVSQFFGLVRES